MKILFTICIVSIFFAASAQSEAELAREAEKLLQAGDTASAIIGYNKLLEKFPLSLPATVRMMELHEATGEFDKAIQYANISLDLIDYGIQKYGISLEYEKDLAAVYYLKGKIRMKQSNYWAAIELLEKSIENNDEFSESYSELARAYFETDKAAKAMEVLKKGIRKAESWKINYNLGVLYTNTKHYDSAKICFLRSLQLNPKMTKPHYFLGTWFFAEEDYENALEHFEEYLSIYPENKEVIYNSATAYMNSELFFEAISMWTRFIKLEGDNSEAYRNRGVANMRISEFVLAIDDLNKSIDIKPSKNYAYVNRGSCYYIQKDYSKAKDDFDIIIRDFNKYPYGYYYRALVLKAQRKKRRSCEDMREAISLGLSEDSIEEGLMEYCLGTK